MLIRPNLSLFFKYKTKQKLNGKVSRYYKHKKIS